MIQNMSIDLNGIDHPMTLPEMQCVNTNQHENQNITFKIKLRGPLQTKRNLPLSGAMEICDQGYGTEHSSE